ncbi:MAG: hypothetical protein K6B44_01135 [Lachnospiraceae bacterium]|nr:hypothetical protein [Lachnospiraceae bacterium]
MTIDAYINPDFGWKEKLIFLLVALLGVVICVLLIIAGVAVSVSLMKAEEPKKKQEFFERTHNRVQRFYEMIISGTSVLSFSCAYVIINHIYAKAQDMGGATGSPGLDSFLNLWAGGKDFILLLLICLSCFLTSLLDRLVIPLKKADRSEKACVRMLAMFYCIIILIRLNSIGDESEYSPVMIYYLGLIVGRFVYFDASLRDFLHALWNMFKNIYLLILCLALAGLLCLFGFRMEYLLEKNYFIVGAFYTHLFMLTAVFILHHSHILSLFIRKPKEEATCDAAA